jgi:rubrerythrin
LALAQAFEDTGVRAYKGQAANLMSKPDLLTAALQIHSVEARHASEVRRLRGQKDGLLVKIVEDCGFRLKELMMGNTLQAGFNTATVSMDPLGQYSYGAVQNLLMSH